MDRFLKCKNKTPRDEEYVSAYLATKSQIKAAELCGVSRETIARAVRRAGVNLCGRTFNNGSGWNRKVTDEELRIDSKAMNCREIAIKYGMGEENVYRRCRKLGLSISSEGAGGHHERRAYRYGVKAEKGITLKAIIKKDGGICQICGLPVNENDIQGGHIRRMYPTIDHITPLSKGGTHTWNNVQLAHMMCNSKKCDKMTPTVKRKEV